MWRPGSIKGGPYSHGCSASSMAFSAFTQFEVSFVDSHSMCVSITGMRVMQYKGSAVADYTWTGCAPFRSVFVRLPLAAFLTQSSQEQSQQCRHFKTLQGASTRPAFER